MLDPVAVPKHELDLTPSAIAILVTGDHDMGRSASNPGVSDQTWRSCTARTPSTEPIARATASTSTPGGAASIRTSSGSRTRRTDEARISTAIAIPTSGSIGFQPVVG